MSQVHATLDHFFRRESGKIVAFLTRFVGAGQIDFAESVVQEALLRAVQSWPVNGIPENPGAWLLKVAKNIAVDELRKVRKFDFDSDEKIAALSAEETNYQFEKEITDDQLKFMFICCHPKLSKDAQLALTLKTICGFGVNEIAKAFLSKEETIAQRIVRAKQKISDEKLKFEVPGPEEIENRLDSVLEVLYLLFNEGYSATEGSELIRRDLTQESIYRLTLLSKHPLCQKSRLFALLSLLHFQASRFNARIDSDGEILLLEEQDRTLWDQEHIHKGLKYLELSAVGEELSDYHLQAGIASCHATASNFSDTDWQRILDLYDVLLMRSHSPIVALNRCVAVAMLYGYECGLAEIETIKELPPLRSYYLLPATIGEIYRRLGRLDQAKTCYKDALKLAGTEPEKRLISKRIKFCEENELKLVK